MDNIEYFTNNRIKLYPTDGDKQFKVISTDPFGLWHIEATRGPTPKALADSQYTDFGEAYHKIDVYLNHKQEEEDTPALDKHMRKVLQITGEMDENGKLTPKAKQDN